MSPEEMGTLGSTYRFGLLGAPKDYKEAAKWYRKAAEQGDADAQFRLGVMYHEGEGVSQDYTEAAKWSRKAAEQGDASAQINLGVMYHLNYAQIRRSHRRWSCGGSGSRVNSVI